MEIEFNGKIYKDYTDDYGYKIYKIIPCPTCGASMVECTDKEDIPGFRSKYIYIVDKTCNCN